MGWLILVLLGLPLVELYLLLRMAEATSGSATFLLVIGTGVLGVWLAQRQGFAVFRRMESEIRQGQTPTDTVGDGALIFLAGLLLLIPGILTDVAGLILLVPPLRRGIKRLLVRRLNVQVHSSFSYRQNSSEEAGDVIDSYVIRGPESDRERPAGERRPELPEPTTHRSDNDEAR